VNGNEGICLDVALVSPNQFASVSVCKWWVPE